VIDREILDRLAAETGRDLAELGVRPADRGWIRRHAESIASLASVSRARPGLLERLYRFARRAARTAR
jgi:hypothetical protein